MVEERARRASRNHSVSKPHDPRTVALDVLTRVRSDDAYVNLVLPTALRLVAPRDRGLVTELVSGTVRMQGAYDAILATLYAKRPKPRVLDVLRLGAHQLLSMRVPDHAAVAETVKLVAPPERAFVNALLRQVAAQDFDDWMDAIGADTAVRFSHPQWVVDKLREALTRWLSGVETTVEPQLEALLAADNAPPKVTLVAHPGLCERSELPGTPTMLSPYGVVLDAGDPAEIAAVREGRAGVQDEGSQLVAIALAEAETRRLSGVETPERWLDLCAGPGGKSALLQALAIQRDATLVANEFQFHRAGLVRKNGVRAVVAGDGMHPPFAPGSFDRVLVDAPCTGLGALRRRAEARWRKTETQLAGLVQLQQALLTSALDLVRRGGVVVYSTCSPVVAETSSVVEEVLAEHRRSSLRSSGFASEPKLVSTTQLWPHIHGTDAMFIATIRKD